MSKHNYSQYSNKKSKPDEPKLVPADLTPEVTEAPEVKMEVEEVTLVDESVDTVILPKTVKGIVSNCARLNVRAYPSIDAEIVCVLDVMSELEVNTDKSTYDWLSVCTATGIEGYCMKKFVDVHL